MSISMAKSRNDPYWLNQNDPRYWEHQRQRVLEMHARLEEKSKPKSIKFELAWDDSVVVEEALQRANTYCGTHDAARGLVHICQDYLNRGPHVRCLDSMAEKKKNESSDPTGVNPG